MFVSLYRIIKFALQNFKRNFWLSIVTISMIVLTLLTVSFVGFIYVLTAEAVSAVEERVDVSVYFKPEVSPDEVKSIKDSLTRYDKIKYIQYISREDSLMLLQKKYSDDVLVQESLAQLGSNPLADTLVIKAYDLNAYPSILEGLDRTYGKLIEKKNYEDNQVFLQRINSITDKTKTVGLIVSSVFAAIAALIVFNTIRIAIYTHSEEINIMKLVGADNWFIRAPFLVEAILYAALGTAVTLVLLYPIVQTIDPYVSEFFDGSFSLYAYYSSNIILFSFWNMVGTFCLTLVASFVAVGRYLDV